MRPINKPLWKRSPLSAVARALCCCFTAINLMAQTGTSPSVTHSLGVEEKQREAGVPIEHPFVSPHPITCESFATLMENTLVEQYELQGTYLIVIARLGERERERGRGLNRSRLKGVEDFLRRKSVKYVTAEGLPVEGPGQIEVYVAGRLRVVIPIENTAKAVCSGKVNPFL